MSLRPSWSKLPAEAPWPAAASGTGCWTTAKRKRPAGWSLRIDLAWPQHRPIPRRDTTVAGQHDDSKTLQLHRRSAQAGSRRPCANVKAAQMLA